MLQAIEQSVDQRLFLEQFVPIGEFEIGRDNCRHAIVARIHQAEEGVDLFRLERQIPQLIESCRALHESTYVESAFMWSDLSGLIAGTASRVFDST